MLSDPLDVLQPAAKPQPWTNDYAVRHIIPSPHWQVTTGNPMPETLYKYASDINSHAE